MQTNKPELLWEAIKIHTYFFIKFIKYLDWTFFYTYNKAFAKKFTANFWKFPDFVKVSSGVIRSTWLEWGRCWQNNYTVSPRPNECIINFNFLKTFISIWGQVGGWLLADIFCRLWRKLMTHTILCPFIN